MSGRPNGPPCVVVAHDDAYAPHAAVTLLSVLEHTPDARLFTLVPSDFRQAAALQGTVGSALSIIRTDPARFADLSVWEGGSVAAYLRLAMGDALDAPRVIYLDSDVVVRTDLGPLWATALSDFVLGAVPDVSFAHRERLGFEPDEPYFNTGVAVIDLERWRADRVAERTILWAQANPERLSWADQCALNGVLRAGWHTLDPGWNMQAAQFGRQTRLGFRFDSHRTGNPPILHFTQPPAHGPYSDDDGKPWHYRCEHPWRDAYRQIATRTAWRERPMPDRYPHNIIRRGLRRHAGWALPLYHALRRVI